MVQEERMGRRKNGAKGEGQKRKFAGEGKVSVGVFRRGKFLPAGDVPGGGDGEACGLVGAGGEKLEYAAEVFRLLGGGALNACELANKLRLNPAQRGRLKGLLELWEHEGQIVRIKRDRFILPEEAGLVTGTVEFQPKGTAYVIPLQGTGPDVFVAAENTGTALHGDMVVARLLTGPGRGQCGRPEGRIVRVLERRRTRIVGVLQRTEKFYHVIPDDPRLPRNIYVPAPEAKLNARPGDKVVARLEAWESRHVSPEGSVVEVLGRSGEPQIELLALMKQYHLPEAFAREVEAEAARVAGCEPLKEFEREKNIRRDCREDFVFTIDPEDAKDFDDAISIRPAAKGWRVAVHIADVAHYVRPGSALDEEAAARGNSVYLPGRVVPMLPEALSNGLCSLRPGEERLAFSVFAEVSGEGRVKGVRFGRSIIRSARRLTYAEALDYLKHAKKGGVVGDAVRVAWDVARILRERRMEAGSLDLDMPECKVLVDEGWRPEAIVRVENDISHQLIEEFMLLANEAVGRFLRVRKQAVIYRVHEAPDPERLEEFRQQALALGVKCGDVSQRAELQRVLASVKGQEIEHAVKMALLRSLARARYSAEPLGHYGLAKRNYLHFTSPIRRYADLVAHRALARQLGLESKGPDSRLLEGVAKHLSGTERNATEAERDAVKRLKLEFFRRQIEEKRGEAFPARILEVRNFGFFVELPEQMTSGFVHLSALEDDFYEFHPSRGELIGRRTRARYRAGMSLSVMVSRVDVYKQQIDFCPVPTESGRAKCRKKPRRG